MTQVSVIRPGNLPVATEAPETGALPHSIEAEQQLGRRAAPAVRHAPRQLGHDGPPLGHLRGEGKRIVGYAAALIDTLDPHGSPSMRQDLVAGRPLELSLFAGTVIPLAEKFGIDVPVNRRLFERLSVAGFA